MVERRFIEDLAIGETNTTPAVSVSETDMIEFAQQYDPQEMHTGAQASARCTLEGLIASGWHTAALVMRILVNSHPLGGTPRLGLGVDDLRWPKPVRPGDVIKAETQVLSTERSRSKPDHGIVRLKVTAYNQHREIIYEMTANLWVPCRTYENHDSGRL